MLRGALGQRLQALRLRATTMIGYTVGMEQKPPIDPSLLVAYSQAQLTRRELEQRIGAPLSFGQLLAALHAQGLALPRVPTHPESTGVQLVKRLAERAGPRVG